MKTITAFFTCFVFSILGAPLTFAMGASSDATSVQAAESPVQAMRQAQQELDQAAAEFSNGEKQASSQQTKQAPLSEALAAPQTQSQPSPSAIDPRNQALQGSPATGYAGTWTDPATGDIMTSVIAPAPQPPQQNYPMVIEPQVAGGSYYGGQQGGWQNWQTSPDNPGYPPRSGVIYGGNTNENQGAQHYPGWMPPYPGQPYPGFNPYPGMNYPPGWWAGQSAGHPPFNPNYRPLTPPQGNIPQPGQFPGAPQQPGYNPPPGNIPPTGSNQGFNNPGSLWRPGMNQPQGALSPAPPMQQLPMRPAGNTWHNSPMAPQPNRGGMFGGGGIF